MKVYVDELPKSCFNCPYCGDMITRAGISVMFCKARKINILENFDNAFDKCSIKNGFQSLSNYTKQVRKEVCEEIKKELSNVSKTYFEDEPYIEICIVKGILDQIENENV